MYLLHIPILKLIMIALNNLCTNFYGYDKYVFILLINFNGLILLKLLIIKL